MISRESLGCQSFAVRLAVASCGPTWSSVGVTRRLGALPPSSTMIMRSDGLGHLGLTLHVCPACRACPPRSTEPRGLISRSSVTLVSLTSTYPMAPGSGPVTVPFRRADPRGR